MRVLPAVACVLAGLLASQALAQDTLETMPRYDRYEKLRREISGSIRYGSVNVEWADDGQSFTFDRQEKSYRFDIPTLKETEKTGDTVPKTNKRKPDRRKPERGRQFDTVFSPDEKWRAVSRDRNVYVSDPKGKHEIAVTKDGDAKSRVKNGVASWVYGEELEVKEAMWFSPDSSKLAFYRFDEHDVKDYYLALDQSKIQDTLDQEPYPLPGMPNPKVQVLVYDLKTKKTTRVDAGFGDGSLAEYVYDVRWSPNGHELLFNRTNRKQNVMQFCAANPSSGVCRVVVEEKHLESWVENHPEVHFLKDNHRFVFMSERNGFANLYLYDLSGKLLNTITQHDFDVDKVLSIDDPSGTVLYTAYSGKPYCKQLHRVQLDGNGDKRLTDPELDHQISVAPDAKHYADIAQNSLTPVFTTLASVEDGKTLATLDKSDTTKFEALKLRPRQVFTFKAADGKTDLYGYLQFPSDFDPSKHYPLLVSVYGGPESGGIAESFRPPDAITELGFLVASFAGRGTVGRGKAFRDAVYGKLGQIEIDDQAAGVKALAARPFVDAKRVGVFGTSYGGYASIMCLLRHPECFAVACASSSVTSWHNYDSIYTERYMGLPDENTAGYEAGSAMQYVKNLQGKLMLYFGSADNNVHPSNTIQLVEALENERKRYDLQIGPDRGHTQMNATRMWEYFVTHLIVRPPKDSLAQLWNKRLRTKRASSIGFADRHH